MVNKYVKIGSVVTAAGIAFGAFGMFMKEQGKPFYGFILIVSVITFGIGFVTIVYSLIRKIERHDIMELRTKEPEEKKNS